MSKRKMFYMGGIDQINDAPAFSLVDHRNIRGNCKVPTMT